jgi:hypothetical protein
MSSISSTVSRVGIFDHLTGFRPYSPQVLHIIKNFLQEKAVEATKQEKERKEEGTSYQLRSFDT